MSPRRCIQTTAAVVLAAFATSGAAASAAEPIEGTWFFGDGQVLVERIGPDDYEGTVVKAIRFAECDHNVGEKMWSITGSGSSYQGTHLWYGRAPSCDAQPGGRSTWKVTDADAATLRMGFCTAPPGQGLPTVRPDGRPTGRTTCLDLKRAKPPLDSEIDCVGDACLTTTDPNGASQGSSGTTDPGTGSGGSGQGGSGQGGGQPTTQNPPVGQPPTPGNGQPAPACVPRGRFTRRVAFHISGKLAKRYKVKRVSFYLNAKRIAVKRSAPFQTVIKKRLAPGTYTIEVRARLVSKKKRVTSKRVRTVFTTCA